MIMGMLAESGSVIQITALFLDFSRSSFAFSSSSRSHLNPHTGEEDTHLPIRLGNHFLFKTVPAKKLPEMNFGKIHLFPTWPPASSSVYCFRFLEVQMKRVSPHPSEAFIIGAGKEIIIFSSQRVFKLLNEGISPEILIFPILNASRVSKSYSLAWDVFPLGMYFQVFPFQTYQLKMLYWYFSDILGYLV